MKRLFFSFFFLLALFAFAFADTEIKAEVDKMKLPVDEMLTYKLIITSTEKILPAPKVPDFTGFEIVSQAQSSTLSYLEKGAKSILVYVFILAPQETGKLIIPPSSIKVRGKEYTTEPFEIEVTPAGKEAPKVTL